MIDVTTIAVATGVWEARGEITFGIDGNSLIASWRVYFSKDGPAARPWHGRLWDCQRTEVRL
ncbi:MAG: hypothetical protein ABI667_09340 [Sphingomicrobium sp.]